MELYRLSKKEFLALLNKDRKTEFTASDVFKREIKISTLKKIDHVFNKGLSYYLAPKDLQVSHEESIFFRKDRFNAELNIGAKQVVTRFEEEKIVFSALSKLADFNTERILPAFSLQNKPKVVAAEIRNNLYPDFNPDLKLFLKSLIVKFAANKILVFEFVENWNKKLKANINGFYLSPNVIVLKRQNYLRREIFTLIHELGHYLLDVEEIDDKVEEDYTAYNSLSKVEKWCSDFAYYFLINDFDETLLNLDKATQKNDFHHELIEDISKRTNLSTIALFTRLRIYEKISYTSYQLVRKENENAILAYEEELKLKKDLEKTEGRIKTGSSPKPILSPLYIQTLKSAYIEGIITESEFWQRLNIKPQKIENYL